MDPRHEMIGIVFIGNVKCARIVGFQNIIRFFFITLWVWLLLWGGGGCCWCWWWWLLLWCKRVWLLLLLLFWGKRVWLLLWGKCVWLLLLKCRLLLYRVCFVSSILNRQATHRSYCINHKYYSCCRFGCRDTTDWIRVDGGIFITNK